MASREPIEILGPAYHLPPPISGTNSAWLRGYPVPPPSTLIVLGTSWKDADRMYTSCHVAGHDGNALGVQNEESQDHPDIFVCGGLGYLGLSSGRNTRDSGNDVG